MAVGVAKPPARQSPAVLRCAAADVRAGDQVAFVSAEQGEHVAGGITGRRASADGSTVALVVDDHVHHVAPGHTVVVIRFRTATNRRLAERAGRGSPMAAAGTGGAR